MKFSFKNSPEWFTNYVTENYLDEFHSKVKSIGIERLGDDHAPLLEAAVEFFSEKGFRSYCLNRELWFDLEETQEITMLALQYS